MNIVPNTEYHDPDNGFTTITTFAGDVFERVEASHITDEPWMVYIASRGDDYTVAEAREFARAIFAAAALAETKNREATPQTEAAPPAAYQMETVAAATFDDKIITADIVTDDGGETFEADIQLSGGGTMTSAEYRAMADRYEAFPTWLRAFADVVDAITKGDD